LTFALSLSLLAVFSAVFSSEMHSFIVLPPALQALILSLLSPAFSLYLSFFALISSFVGLA